MKDERYIIIPNWKKFQHYDPEVRNPPWIKVYTELNSRDNWLDLTLYQRGLLLTIWLEYARAHEVLTVHRCVHACVGSHDGRYGNVKRALDSLLREGFIELSASRPLALARSREKRRKEVPKAVKTVRVERPGENFEEQVRELEQELAEHLEGLS